MLLKATGSFANNYSLKIVLCKYYLNKFQYMALY